MMNASDLPETIPIFPLPGALLLPRARLPLHLFEPRYLTMLEDVLKTPHRLIGMIQPYDQPDGSTALQTIGCAGRVTQFSETDNSRYLITLSGMSRFRIKSEVTGFTPYRRFMVDWAGFDRDLGPPAKDPGFDRASFFDLLGRYLSEHQLDTDWDTLKQAEDELLINSLSMLLRFGHEDKQALLEAPSLSTRRETLVTLIEFALRGGDTSEVMQ